jgi:hypothetical protein
MAMKSRAAQWLKMAEAARSMAFGTHDPGGKRLLLGIAASYDELAAWATESDAANAER